jgi:hypothetical protein
MPNFVDSTYCPFYYAQTAGITDVNTIISDLRTALVTNLSYTEPTTALFKSPVVDGMFFDVLVTRISATNLEFRFRDYRGQTYLTGRIQIDATQTVNYFCNKYGMVVESLRAQVEIAQAHLLDLSANQQTAQWNRFICGTYRTSADTGGQQDTVGKFFAYDGTAVAASTSRSRNGTNAANTAWPLLMASGTLLYDEYLIKINQGGVQKWSGRLFQSYVCDSSLAFSTEKTIPIDDAGTLGTFRVIGLATSSNRRTMMRKA